LEKVLLPSFTVTLEKRSSIFSPLLYKKIFLNFLIDRLTITLSHGVSLRYNYLLFLVASRSPHAYIASRNKHSIIPRLSYSLKYYHLLFLIASLSGQRCFDSVLRDYTALMRCGFNTSIEKKNDEQSPTVPFSLLRKRSCWMVHLMFYLIKILLPTSKK
jgi:hypothetical protein